MKKASAVSSIVTLEATHGDETVSLVVSKSLTVGAAKRLSKLQALLGDGTELEGEALTGAQETFIVLVRKWSFEEDLTIETLDEISMDFFIEMLNVVMTHFGMKVETVDEETAPEAEADSPS